MRRVNKNDGMMNMIRRKTKRELAGALILSMLASISLPAAACAEEIQYEPCEITIPVSVLTVGTDVPEGMEYQIVIEDIENESAENTPMPQITEAVLKDGAEYDFGPIVYTVPGTYLYEISQVAGNHAYVTYDETKYEVVVQVDAAEIDNRLWLLPQISGLNETKSKAKTRSISFENEYDKPTAAETTAAETTVAETTRGGGGGGGGGSDSTPSGTTAASTEATKATEQTSESATETSEVPEKPVYPELPDVPLKPDGTPDIPEGTEIEIYDLNNPSEPVYRGPYSDDIDLPAGRYEIVMLDDEGVPLASGIFTIDEEGVARGTLPKTGDSSIPFVLLALLLAGSAAGMTILIRKIRQSEE
jgi:pilin isopeptide linkage protein/LPXTG-motif cell wall-anchored protein